MRAHVCVCDVCMCTRMCVHMYTCMNVCVCVCVRVCVSVCACIPPHVKIVGIFLSDVLEDWEEIDVVHDRHVIWVL